MKCASALDESVGPYSVVFTDPPYYDVIPYSDLMDYFYIWQRRITAGLGDEIDAVFRGRVAPKWDHQAQDGELVEDESRHGGNRQLAKAAYEDGMLRAFQRMWTQLDADGRLVVVFANKEVDAWETMVGALMRGGVVVTASWPIQTERTGRVAE